MKKLLLSMFLIFFVLAVKAQSSNEETAALKELDSLIEPTNAASVKNQKEIGAAINIIKKITVLNAQYSKQIKTYERIDEKGKLRQETLYMKFLLSEISSIYSQGVFFLNKENTIAFEEKENYEEKYNSTISESLEDFEFAIRIITRDDLKMSENKVIAIIEDIKTKQYDRRDLMAFYNDKISSVSKYNHLNNSINKVKP